MPDPAARPRTQAAIPEPPLAKLAISRLLDGLKRTPHDLRSSLQVFPDINVDRVAKDLDVVGRGRERGARGEPPPEAAGLDEVELRIVERIESEKRQAHAGLVDEMRSYGQRMVALDFEGRFSAIRQAAPETLGEFRTEATQGRDELVLLARKVREVEQERDAFKRENGIRRVGRQSSRGAMALKVGLLLLLFAVEVALNGAFLAKGNELGLVGGAVEAVAFAALNIGAAYLIAVHGVRQVMHRGVLRKLVGAVSILAWLALAVGINLMLAHYREVSGTLVGEAGTVVIERIRQNPLGLTDLKSWLFLAIGLLFSAVAFADSLAMHDPYPGYGELEARVAAAHQDYADARADLTDRLRNIRDEALESMKEVGRDLAARRAEYDAIVEGRTRLVRLFVEHQNHLERTAQALLATYRESNAAARKVPRPAAWTHPFALARIDASLELPTETPGAREEMRRGVEEAIAVLERQVEAIQAEFEGMARTYREIEVLIPEEGRDGAPVQKAA